MHCSIKGKCHEIFALLFFSQKILPGPHGPMYIKKPNGFVKFFFAKIFSKNMFPCSRWLCWHPVNYFSFEKKGNWIKYLYCSKIAFRRSCWLYCTDTLSAYVVAHNTDTAMTLQTMVNFFKPLTNFKGTIKQKSAWVDIKQQ